VRFLVQTSQRLLGQSAKRQEDLLMGKKLIVMASAVFAFGLR